MCLETLNYIKIWVIWKMYELILIKETYTPKEMKRGLIEANKIGLNNETVKVTIKKLGGFSDVKD